MKFYIITSKNLKRLLAPLVAVLLTSSFQAQNVSNSPYSRFGVGDLQPIQTPRNVGMGGLSVGLVRTSSLTTRNPASYMNLDSLLVNFEVSLFAKYSTLHEKVNDEIVTANTNSASLGQITFAFPIAPWLKSSFGLTPHSNMSYDVVRERDGGPNVGRQILNNEGRGGLNQVFVGFAAGTSRVSVGANINYQFGSFTRNTRLVFADTILQVPTMTQQYRYFDAMGFSVNLGLQYKQPLADRYQFGFGFAFTPRYRLSATRDFQILSIPVVGSPDTIPTGNFDKEGTLQMPDMYTFGLSFERLDRWIVGAEYSIVNFENYLEFGYRDPNLVNAHTLRVGMELIGQRLDNNFLNRLSYRFGYHHGTSYVAFDELSLTQSGVSFGIGMPIRRGFSRVDFEIFCVRIQRFCARILRHYGILCDSECVILCEA